MDIQLPQIIFQIINFSVVVGALTYFLYKPVLKILDERSSRIEKAQKEAEATLAEKAKIDELKQKTKKEAEKEAAQIMKQAQLSAQEQADAIIAKAKEKAAAQLANLKEDWESEKKQQQAQMKKEFNESVLMVTEKVLGKVFDKKTHEKLIDQEVAALIKQI